MTEDLQKNPAAGGNRQRDNQIHAASASHSARIPANHFGRYEYDTATGDRENVRRWRAMAAAYRKRSADIRRRASSDLNVLLGVMFPAPAPTTNTYSLSDEYRRKYASELMANQVVSWQPWEIQQRFTAPETRAA